MADNIKTVSDALRRGATLKGLIGEHRKRAAASVVYTDPAKPAFEFEPTAAKANRARDELVRLQAAVQLANSKVEIEWKGKKISVALAVRIREECKSEIKWYRELEGHCLAQETLKADEFSYDDDGKRVRVEKTQHCVLIESKRADMVDRLQGEHDELNALIEKSNGHTEIAL
jgi:hypothetical protein